jgi:hypothetical protein
MMPSLADRFARSLASTVRRACGLGCCCLCGFPHARLVCFLAPSCLRRTDKEADDIPLLNVKAAVLKKVVEYMRYHAENPPKDIEKVRHCCQFTRCLLVDIDGKR